MIDSGDIFQLNKMAENNRSFVVKLHRENYIEVEFSSSISGLAVNKYVLSRLKSFKVIKF